ncbi:VHS domain-containing protein [Trichoderma austrokoningii]
MEAASARAATRDRWGEAGRSSSQLLRFIQGACSPENYEPNLALNLEVSDLINSKKGTAPREAATAIVGFVNHRNPNVALLALSLLDICVKNCGYPFHLQISTKEFLNELVRRFPERPPIRATRVQSKILELIEEWRMTICETSRYRDDLGFIRDMHRLLSYKGYMFPEVRREDAAVLNPSDNLKSAEEMEEEEREAQSAKLQELIRRGTPEDLQEANRLMKVMAGYDTRSKTDYRAKAAEDVGKIQAKARLLEERLEAFRPGDKMEDGDVFSELAAALQSAQPKIQKMCEEESDDHEAVARLLEINDSIHRTVERYKLMKKGDMDGAAKIAAGAPPPSHSGAPPASAANELSLIDFDGDAAQSNGASSSQAGGLENDLLGLDIGSPSSAFGQGGNIALGFGANQNIPGPALLSSLTQGSTARGAGQNDTPPPFSQFASFTSPPVSQSATPQPNYQQQTSPPQPNYQQTSPPQPNYQQQTSPPQPNYQQTSPPQPNYQQTSPPQPNYQQQTSPPASNAFASFTSPPAPKPAADDDEWNFSSALPAEQAPAKPTEHKGTAGNSSLKTDFLAKRSTAVSNAINIVFAFSNNTAQPINELHFQLAVTKGYELQLKPQTGRALSPKQSRGVTQEVDVWHAGNRNQRVESVKLRWRASYRVGEEVRNEMGEIAEFSLA